MRPALRDVFAAAKAEPYRPLSFVRARRPSRSTDATIGITGGEPTLFKDDLFHFLLSVSDARPDLRFHVLTNAQHFVDEDIDGFADWWMRRFGASRSMPPRTRSMTKSSAKMARSRGLATPCRCWRDLAHLSNSGRSCYQERTRASLVGAISCAPSALHCFMGDHAARKYRLRADKLEGSFFDSSRISRPSRRSGCLAGLRHRCLALQFSFMHGTGSYRSFGAHPSPTGSVGIFRFATLASCARFVAASLNGIQRPAVRDDRAAIVKLRSSSLH